MTRFFLLLIALLSTSCATNVGTGLIAGTILGGGSGWIPGGGKGALIGSAVGAITGGLVGTVLDAQDRKVMECLSPRTVERIDRNEPLTISDVIKLSQSGVSDDTILSYMKESGSSYTLSQPQIQRLQDAGVSQRVVNYMVETIR